MTVETRPLSYALGAEVVGIDLNRPLSESEFGGIYRAFLDHGVLLLRGQGARMPGYTTSAKPIEIEKQNTITS